ncbi:restriction endonuclease [Mycobacterium camsae]|uniref:restriction endonuclease n=1 Tax=Mycobacterium gordonae TaxID=1778 RepID=UPI00197E2A9D|nr:restriction endonuclease [Mycobacterium gordonae]
MFVKSGTEFEKFVAQVFAANGHHATVTKNSGDYGVDLVLNGEIAVQAKFYGSVVGPSAVQEVVAGRAVYGCSEAWVVTNSTFTPAAVTLAKANGVRLIAGDELQWLAENPERSTEHAARYRAHLAELEAKELAEHNARLEAAEAKRQARRAALKDECDKKLAAGAKLSDIEQALLGFPARDEQGSPLQLQRMAALKDECEKKLAAGEKLSDVEQARLARAKGILRDAGLTAPDEQGSPLPGQSFRNLLARRATSTAPATAVAHPTGPVPRWGSSAIE